MPQIALRPFMAAVMRAGGHSVKYFRAPLGEPGATILPQHRPGSSRSRPISARLTQESDNGWETDEPLAALSD
jgi:hypothetical protein